MHIEDREDNGNNNEIVIIACSNFAVNSVIFIHLVFIEWLQNIFHTIFTFFVENTV